MSPVAIDLFAGAGGFSLGLSQAGFQVVLAVEKHPKLAQIYQANFNHPLAIADIRNLDWDNKELGEIDFLVGGPPCQGFSVQGKRDESDPRSSLLLEFSRAILVIQPKYWALENVPGILNSKFKNILNSFQDSLNLCYDIANPEVIDAATFGVPQKRKRVFIIGSRKDCSPVKLVLPPAKPVTVREALCDLPDPENYTDVPHDTDTLFIPDWGKDKYWSPYGLEMHFAQKTSYLYNSRIARHTPEVIARFKQLAWGERDKISRKYKLDPDAPASTLTAGGDGSFTANLPIHPFSPRVLNVREAARLHSFPDWFVLGNTRLYGARGIGNSVCPKVAKAIASSIYEKCL